MDAVALASVITSGLVGFAAVGGAYLSGGKDRRHSERLAEQARRQERLERTYREVIIYIDRKQAEANNIRPLLTVTGEERPPQMTYADAEQILALVVCHASPEVYRLLERFNEALHSIRSKDIAITGMEQERAQTQSATDPATWGGSMTDYRQRIEQDRAQLLKIAEQIHEQIRSELHSDRES